MQKKKKREWHNHNIIMRQKKKGDMAELVDATDLIGLSLGTETY